LTRADTLRWVVQWGLTWSCAFLLGTEWPILLSLAVGTVGTGRARHLRRWVALLIPALMLGLLTIRYALDPADASALSSIGVLCALQLCLLLGVQGALMHARSGVFVGRALLVTLTVSCAFLLGELMAQRIWPRVAHGIQAVEGSLVREPYLPDPELQHVQAPGFRGTFVHPEYWNEPFETNDDGFRDAAWPTDAPAPGELRVLLLGDSTTVGFGVHMDETIAARLEELLRERSDSEVRVLNGGVAGYSPCHAELLLDRVIERVQPTHVVCLVYDGNDLSDCRRRFVHAREAGVHDRVLATEPATRAAQQDAGTLFGRTYWYRYSALYRRLEISLAPFVARSGLVEPDHAYTTMLRLTSVEPTPDVLEELDLATAAALGMHERCSLASIPFVLARLPARVQTEPGSFEDLVRRFGGDPGDHDRGRPGRTLLERVRAESLPVVDLLPVLEVEGHGPNPRYFLEGHPNREGNRAIAEALAPMIE
jgi:hypothetical protein